MTNQTLKNQLRRHFSDVIVVMLPKILPNLGHKTFKFWAPPNQTFWLRKWFSLSHYCWL